MTPTKEIFEVVKPLSNFVETTFSLSHQSLFLDDPLFSSTSLTCDDGCSCRITDSQKTSYGVEFWLPLNFCISFFGEINMISGKTFMDRVWASPISLCSQWHWNPHYRLKNIKYIGILYSNTHLLNLVTKWMDWKIILINRTFQTTITRISMGLTVSRKTARQFSR